MSPFVRRPSIRHADRILARSVMLLVVAVYALTVAATPSLPSQGMSLAANAWRDTPTDALLAWPFLVLAQAMSWVTEPHSKQALQDVALNLRGPLCGAWTAWLVVLVARRLGANRPSSWLVGLLYAFTTYAWPAARSAAPESAATLLLFASFHQTLRIREGYERLKDPSRWLFSGLGLALAACAGVRWVFLPAALGSLLVAIVVIAQGHRRLRTTRWAPDRRRGGYALDLALVLVPFAAGIGLLFALAQPQLPDLLPPHGATGRALAALLISPGFGLLPLAPLLFLVPWALHSASRGGESLWLWSALVTLVTLLVPALAWTMRHGPYGYGPLLLLPVLPLLFAGMARIGRRRRSMVAVAAAAACFGLLQQLPATLLSPDLGRRLGGEARAVVSAPEVSEDAEGAQSSKSKGPLSADAWDLRQAPPGVLWRVLRREVAVGDGRFPLDEVFLRSGFGVLEFRGRTWDLGLVPYAPSLRRSELSVSGPAPGAQAPASPRELQPNGGGVRWWAVLMLGVIAWVGGFLAFQGLDPAAP